MWRPALAAAGLGYRAYDQLRHTFATLAIAAGADVYWLSKQMGHKNPAVTLKHYGRFLTEANARNVALLDAYAAENGHGADTELEAGLS